MTTFQQRILGTGGYGQVVELDGHRVAKIQTSDNNLDPGVSCAVLREMVALSRIDGGARMGRVLLERDGTCAIEIRRFQKTVLDAIRESDYKGMPRDLIDSTLADIVTELHRAHSMGIIHRDLKPENVMYDSQGKAHIIDWGMSRWARTEAEDNGGGIEKLPAGKGPWTPGMSTIWYRAPELFTGDEYGPEVDMWSLGVMLVEMATGMCPFRGRTELAQIKHLVEVLGLPPKMDREHMPLPNWPFPNRSSRTGEPDRTAIWEEASRQIKRHGTIGGLINRLVRWDPRTRMTSAMAAHLVVGRMSMNATPPPHQLLPTATHAHQQLHLTAPASNKLIYGICKIIIPLCTRAVVKAMIPPVLWIASRFLLVALSKDTKMKHPVLLINAVACLDVANKIAGRQTTSIFRRLHIRDARAVQVRLVNEVLGLDEIAKAMDRCPAIAGREINHHHHHHPHSLHASLLKKALEDAMLVCDPVQALCSTDLSGLLLEKIAAFVVTGRLTHLRRIPIDRPIEATRLAEAISKVLTSSRTGQAGAWRALHTNTWTALKRDHIMRKRLVLAIAKARTKGSRTK